MIALKPRHSLLRLLTKEAYPQPLIRQPQVPHLIQNIMQMHYPRPLIPDPHRRPGHLKNIDRRVRIPRRILRIRLPRVVIHNKATLPRAAARRAAPPARRAQRSRRRAAPRAHVPRALDRAPAAAARADHAGVRAERGQRALLRVGLGARARARRARAARGGRGRRAAAAVLAHGDLPCRRGGEEERGELATRDGSVENGREDCAHELVDGEERGRWRVGSGGIWTGGLEGHFGWDEGGGGRGGAVVAALVGAV